jgi:hypothetical protein
MTNVKLLTNEEKQGVQMAMMQAQITGQPPQIPPDMMELMEQPSWEDVKALLADNTLRSFRIDVETDSTIEPDETAAKQAYNEFVTATVGLMQAAAGIIPAAPNTAPLFAEFMKQGARIYDAPRSLEDVIEKVFGGLEQMPPAQPPGPPQPDPAQMEAEAMKGQVEMQKLQVEQQRTQQEGQLGMMDAQLRAQELQLKGQALARDPNPQGFA